MSERPYRVTVVCHGNICRSPMAEFLLREAFEDAGLADRVQVDSAGTSSEEVGNPPHRRTLATLQRHGHRDLGWSRHRARQFRPEWFENLDLVLAADHPHADRLLDLARTDEEARRVRLVRSFDPEAVAAGELGMDDPWYGGDADYEQTYQEIRAAVPGIVEHVRSHLGAG
ncbi:low molecular weight phosphotyrosine protein phosphatase [Phycicoccus endophyticus]|uniref:protein-tyrosine-phosphatase n=1 Tax=Phycicoccus endophyticus TaxID=1690220 RepID=A0A7G9R1C3_9MICO|nr:low molecular weight protein-tyrosine-phosphatase [Phycicoccus endophyticus]NHI18823.1 low molecular weight phosphotyrosine protein phosphatase [Phycicoccus endophyticus]QNN49398.1 low molecular weight phosphotyrosine protein phosphatase [Phycicoccus endophyticus]GGL36269.1 protein-tyrosine-phosphatase [Phycicoccus endophyticus]